MQGLQAIVNLPLFSASRYISRRPCSWMWISPAERLEDVLVDIHPDDRRRHEQPAWKP